MSPVIFSHQKEIDAADFKLCMLHMFLLYISFAFSSLFQLVLYHAFSVFLSFSVASNVCILKHSYNIPHSFQSLCFYSISYTSSCILTCISQIFSAVFSSPIHLVSFIYVCWKSTFNHTLLFQHSWIDFNLSYLFEFFSLLLLLNTQFTLPSRNC